MVETSTPLLTPRAVNDTILPTPRIELRCAGKWHDQRGEHFCGNVYAYLENGMLFIVSIHHGEKHVNVIPLISALSLLPEREYVPATVSDTAPHESATSKHQRQLG